MEAAWEQHEADLKIQAQQQDLLLLRQNQQRSSARQMAALFENLLVRALSSPAYEGGRFTSST